MYGPLNVKLAIRAQKSSMLLILLDFKLKKKTLEMWNVFQNTYIGIGLMKETVQCN